MAEFLRKLAEFKRGRVVEADVTHTSPRSDDFYVVGVVKHDGNVLLSVYRGAETEPRAERQIGRATSLSVSAIGNPNDGDSEARKFVSVMRDSEGDLRAILWGISPDGRRLDRLHTVLGPKINHVDVASSGFGDARVVAEKATGTLMACNLILNAGTRLALGEKEHYGSGVKALALESGFVGGLAMRLNDDTLRVSSFASGGDSGVLRLASGRGGAVSDLDIVEVDSSNGTWATITSSAPVDTNGWFVPGHCNNPIVVPFGPIGRAKLIAWQNNDPQPHAATSIGRVAEYEFGTRQGLAHEVAVASHRPKWFITGHLGYSKPCAFKPRLELHLWEFDEDDGFRKAASTKLGGDYRGLAMSDFANGSTSSNSRFTTVMRGRVDQTLKIAVWEADSTT